MIMAGRYSTMEVCEALGIKRERLREWVVRKFIRPLQPFSGQGVEGVFDESDVYAVAVFKNLVENRRFSRDLAGKMMTRWVGAHHPGAIEYVGFVFEGKKIIAVNYRDGEHLHEVLTKVPDYDSIYIVNFRGLKKIVDEKLMEIEEKRE
jgi:hypothetical protein